MRSIWATARRMPAHCAMSATELSGKDFPAGSMVPKISAAIEFVQATGNPAAIGRLEDAAEIVKRLQGTWFEP